MAFSMFAIKLILVLAVTSALEVQVEVDGNPLVLNYAVEENFTRVAEKWTEMHPDIDSGAGCEHSMNCIASVVVEAMNAELGYFGQLLVANKNQDEWPRTDEATYKKWLSIAAEECSVVGDYTLEQMAGLCYIKEEEKTKMAAVWLAGACLGLEPERMHAAKFGLLAATELSAISWSARFALHIARLKRPVSGDSVNPLEASGPLQAMGIVRLDDTFEFRTVQFGALHDASLEFYGDQLRYILEHRSRGCLISNSTLSLAAHGFYLLALKAKEERQTPPLIQHLDLLELASHMNHLNEPAIQAALQLYGRLVCLVPDDTQSTILQSSIYTKADAVASDFLERGVAIVDDVLTPDALNAVRNFVLGSTIFTRTYIQGYLGAFWADGFGASPIVQRVAHNLQSAFPKLLRDKVLRQAWAYVYARRSDDDAESSHPKGIDAHADDADVSVNLWITPDSANLGRGHRLGGLVIYPTKPPDDWSFSQANSNSRAIYNLLATDSTNNDETSAKDPIIVPYKCNRVTLLDGFRFHQTDTIDFKPGYDEHRINLTFLFRKPDRPPMGGGDQ